MKKVLVNVSDNGVIALPDGTIISKLHPDVDLSSLPEYKVPTRSQYLYKNFSLTVDGAVYTDLKEFTTHYDPNKVKTGGLRATLHEVLLDSGKIMYFTGDVSINYLCTSCIHIVITESQQVDAPVAVSLLETYAESERYRFQL